MKNEIKNVLKETEIKSEIKVTVVGGVAKPRPKPTK